MKIFKSFYFLPFFLMTLILISCSRSSYDVWEDTKSCGRHMSRGLSCLGGKNIRSRAVCSPDEFYYEDCYEDPVGEDFIPLIDDSRPNLPGSRDIAAPPPRETPGERGSSLPGIEAFSDPTLNPGTAGIFKNIYFEYDSSYIKGDENLAIVRNIAQYMISHPNMYLFIEGHCDERGPEAYNLALGARRAHAAFSA
jgi:peptidoglycan-associated lipoprotein